jgi:hypothetical protein
MSNQFQAFWDELYVSFVETAWPDVTINYRAMQTARINWKNLIEKAAMTPPYTVTQVGRGEPGEWGLAAKSLLVPITAHYITRTEPQITTVATGVASATQTLTSSTGIVAGMRLWFTKPGTNIRTVQSVGLGGAVTLDSTITTTTGQAVGAADTSEWIEGKLCTLRDLLLGDTSAKFEMVDEPSIDSGEGNPVNEVLAQGNFAMQAGSLSFTALLAEGF